MKKFVLDTKATLGLVNDKTVDDDYQKRAASLKLLSDALSGYNASMEKTKFAVEELIKSLEYASKAFEGLDGASRTPGSQGDFVVAFKESVGKLEKETLVSYIKSMNTDVVKPCGNTKMLYDTCIRLEQQRNKVVNEYDVYRSSVSKKETDYAKKGKSLKDSKSYEDEVQKRDELKAKYEEADRAFKQEHDTLEAVLKKNNKLCAREFMDSMSALLLQLSRQVEQIREKTMSLSP